jgi:hypothetical protein
MQCRGGELAPDSIRGRRRGLEPLELLERLEPMRFWQAQPRRKTTSTNDHQRSMILFKIPSDFDLHLRAPFRAFQTKNFVDLRVLISVFDLRAA